MAISCSETTLVSTKQGLAVMFVKLSKVFKQEKCYKSTQNFFFTFTFCLFNPFSD